VRFGPRLTFVTQARRKPASGTLQAAEQRLGAATSAADPVAKRPWQGCDCLRRRGVAPRGPASLAAASSNAARSSADSDLRNGSNNWRPLAARVLQLLKSSSLDNAAAMPQNNASRSRGSTSAQRASGSARALPRSTKSARIWHEGPAALSVGAAGRTGGRPVFAHSSSARALGSQTRRTHGRRRRHPGTPREHLDSRPPAPSLVADCQRCGSASTTGA
jgi:hypothetical protein